MIFFLKKNRTYCFFGQYNSQTTLCRPVTPPCIICTTPTEHTFHVCSDPAITFKYDCPDRTTCKPYNPCTKPPNTTRRKCTTCPTTRCPCPTTRCPCPARATTAPPSCQSCQYKYKSSEY